jgi:hypothetical protein
VLYEDKLINHAIERAKLGIGFRKQNFLGFAGDLATKKKNLSKTKVRHGFFVTFLPGRHYELYKNQTKNIELKI